MKGRSVRVESWRNTKHNRIVMRRSFRAFNAGKKGVGWRAKEARDVAGLWMGRSIRVESWKSMKHGRIVWGGILEPSNAGKKGFGSQMQGTKKWSEKMIQKSKNETKNPSKNFKNRSKGGPKSIQKGQKSLQNAFWTSRNEKQACLCNFFHLFPIFWGPRASQNEAKISKNEEKSLQNNLWKKRYFQRRFFNACLRIWPCQNEAKMFTSWR